MSAGVPQRLAAMVEFASDVVVQRLANARQAVDAEPPLDRSPAAIQPALGHLARQLQDISSGVAHLGSFVYPAQCSMARLSRGKAVCTTTKILIAYAIGSHRDIVNAL